MRIAIVNLTGGGLSGGYKKYLRNILPLIAKDERIDTLDVYLPAGQKDVYNSNQLRVYSIIGNNLSGSKAWVKHEIAKLKADVVYIPSGIWIDYDHAPIVTMIRNMEPLVVPFQRNPLKECIKNIGRYMANLYSCMRSDRIIAISKFVKTYLIEKWRIPEGRIGLVYHGINAPMQGDINDIGSVASLKSIPFIFTAGSIRPARGLEDIIKALALLKIEQPLCLVIGGKVDPGMESYFVSLKELTQKLEVFNRIHWVGNLNDAEMAWCYLNCKIFVMTSRVEACPNIVLEAMANGCVSISTESSPMPEFFQDSAVYYPPKDEKVLAERILEVMSWPEEKRKEMSERAKKRASQFSWEICAQKTIEQFQIAIEEFRRKKGHKRIILS